MARHPFRPSTADAHVCTTCTEDVDDPYHWPDGPVVMEREWWTLRMALVEIVRAHLDVGPPWADDRRALGYMGPDGVQRWIVATDEVFRSTVLLIVTRMNVEVTP